MKININGITREMTAEEIAEMELINSEFFVEEPSQLDRIEAQTMYTALMTDTLI